jgi:hypothetical protein
LKIRVTWETVSPNAETPTVEIGTSMVAKDAYSDADEIIDDISPPKLHRIISFRSFDEELDMTEALREGSILKQHNAFLRHVA